MDSLIFIVQSPTLMYVFIRLSKGCHPFVYSRPFMCVCTHFRSRMHHGRPSIAIMAYHLFEHSRKYPFVPYLLDRTIVAPAETRSASRRHDSIMAASRVAFYALLRCADEVRGEMRNDHVKRQEDTTAWPPPVPTHIARRRNDAVRRGATYATITTIRFYNWLRQ